MSDKSINILFFGSCAEATERNQWQAAAPVTLCKLKEILEQRWPRLHQLKYSFAHNQQIVNDLNTKLCPGDELALLQPFSGG